MAKKLFKTGLICKIIVLTLILSTINPTTIKVDSAPNMGVITLSTDASTIYVNDEFIVNVSIFTHGFEGIMSFTALKEYDSSVVQYLGSTICGSGQIQQDTDIYEDSTDSYGKIMVWNTETYKNDELIIQMKFKALEATTSSNIILKNMSANGKSGELISYDKSTLANASLNIKIQEPPEPPEVMPFSCRVDYENRRLLIDKGSNSMFFLSLVDTKGKVKPYEIYEANSPLLKIDISSYSAYKEWNFILYGDVDTTPITITTVPAIKGLKASYNPLGYSVDERIQLTIGEDEYSVDEMEVRTVGGKWEDAANLTEEQLDTYAVAGTTLVFRIKAIEDESPYSSDAKLKVQKRASAPKITIDVSKLTIKFPKNSEYRLKHTDVWKTSPSGTVTIASLVDIKAQDFYMEIRTEETETKPVSKYTITSIGMQAAEPVIGEDASANLLITNTKGNGITTGVTIKNTSEEKDIEYAIVPANTNINSINLSKQKWKKLTKNSEVLLKIKESDGKLIIARYAAVTGKNTTLQFASQIGKSSVVTWEK